MKQVVLDNVNKLVCWCKKNRKCKIKESNEQTIKVNAGSGLRVAEGWINVDAMPHAMISRWPKFALRFFYKLSGANQSFTYEEYCNIIRNNKFIHHRIEYGLPFEDCTIDYLYCSHMLEHLYREDSKIFLKHAFRVLKNKGVFRVSVPDLEYAFSRYKEGDIENTLRLFFVPTKYNYLYQHRYIYDFNLLKRFLEEAGFDVVVRRQFREGSVPDLEKLDIHAEESLFVEATKTMN